jgi:hypothetical protein
MTTYQCKTCNGEYSPTAADGSRYYHACPDSVPAGQRRDENVKSTAEKDAGSQKAPGAGFTVK